MSVRNRYQRFVSKPLEHRNQVGNVETSVQGGDVRNWQIATNRKMKVASVKMNQVKLLNVLDDMICQKDFPGDGVFAALVFPERPLAGRDKPRFCNRVAAGKQCHVVPGRDQFFSEERDDSLGASIVFWRHAFD